MTAVLEREQPAETERKRVRQEAEPKRRVPASAGASLFSKMLSMVCAIIIVLLLNLVLLSPVQHSMSQKALYDQLRVALYDRSAPVGQTLNDDPEKLVPLGTPMALLNIPDLDINEVVVEGTTSAQTMQGVGHLRNTPLPGQAGISVLMGRSGAYGGIFGQLNQLKPGMRIKVTTGQGEATFQVRAIRKAGDPTLPAPDAKEGRLTLTTAAGQPFLPSDALRVDAVLISDPFPTGPVVLSASSTPDAEKALGQDFSQLFGLVILLQLLLGACMAGAWCRSRWGKWQSWIVFVPVIGSLTVLVGNQINLLLPNLL